MNHHVQLELIMRKYKNLWGGINLATINPYDFEELMAHFLSIWYVKDVKFTKKSQDHGIDAYIKVNDTYLVIFQMKRYNKKNKVDERTIRDLYGCMADCQISQGYLPQGVMITTGSYSQPARDWARGKKIILITGGGLVELFHKKGFNNIYLDFDETPTKIANKAQQMEAELKKREEQKKHLEEIKKYNAEVMAKKHEDMRQDARKHQQILQEKEEERKKKIQHPVETQGKVDNKYEDCDELLDEAIKIVRESGQVSTSYLQRRLRIGFNRAARILEELESSGIISARDGHNPRQVLISKEDEKYKKEIEEMTRKKYEEEKRLEIINKEIAHRKTQQQVLKAEKRLEALKKAEERKKQAEVLKDKKRLEAEQRRLEKKKIEEQKKIAHQQLLDEKEKQHNNNRVISNQNKEMRKKVQTAKHKQFVEVYGRTYYEIIGLNLLEILMWILLTIIPIGIASSLGGTKANNYNMYVLGIYINIALLIHIIYKYIKFKRGKNIFEDDHAIAILLKFILVFIILIICLVCNWIFGLLFLFLIFMNYFVLHQIFKRKSN